MKKEDFDYLERTLRELSLFIAELKAQEPWYIEDKKKASLRSLFYLVGGKNDPNVSPAPAPMRNTVVSQSNSFNDNEKGVSTIEKKENIEMLIDVPGLSVNRKPRNDGRFQGYIITEHGKKYVYGKTYNEVVSILNHYYKTGVPIKKRKTLATVNGIPATFNKFALYYFENFRKKKVAESTYYSDLLRYRKYLAVIFKEKLLKNITPLDCQKVLDALIASKKLKTADEIYCLLSIIFKTAIKHGVLKSNPLDVVVHTMHERKHGIAFTPEEELRLKTEFAKTPYLSFIMFALFTGLRPNEYKTARIEGDFIVAVNSKRKHKRIEYKKIPIISALKPYVANGLPAEPRLNVLRKMLKRLFPNHKIYDLRTTFYTRCKEFGVAEPALNHYVGHSPGTLAGAYTDLSDNYLLTEGKKLNLWQIDT